MIAKGPSRNEDGTWSLRVSRLRVALGRPTTSGPGKRNDNCGGDTDEAGDAGRVYEQAGLPISGSRLEEIVDLPGVRCLWLVRGLRLSFIYGRGRSRV
jgi:hypothetical protein